MYNKIMETSGSQHYNDADDLPFINQIISI